MDEMNVRKSINRRFETIAWGFIFVLIGVLTLIPGEQNDLLLLGMGIILLGFNLARYFSKIQVNVVTIVFGAVSFIVGMVAILRPVMNLHFKIPLFPVLLLAIGIIFFIGGLKPAKDV